MSRPSFSGITSISQAYSALRKHLSSPGVLVADVNNPNSSLRDFEQAMGLVVQAFFELFSAPGAIAPAFQGTKSLLSWVFRVKAAVSVGPEVVFCGVHVCMVFGDLFRCILLGGDLLTTG